MKHSHGYNAKRSGRVNFSGRISPTKLLRSFKEGQQVRIRVYGSTRTGTIPLRFNFRIAKVVKQQGNAYVVEFKDGNKVKRLTVVPIHLEPFGTEKAKPTKEKKQ